MLRYLFFLSCIFLSTPVCSFAQDILQDLNEDGVISALSFGDSITRGVGDSTLPGAFIEMAPLPVSGGYPLRASNLLGISINNAGISGEVLTDDGVGRFPSVAQSSSADLILILEGTNDAIFRTGPVEYQRALQRLVNISKATGKNPVLMTLLPPCCDRVDLSGFTDLYNSVVQTVAAINGLTVIDLDRVWRNSCAVPLRCDFYNIPEGLHPNMTGYDLIAQAVSGSLLGIDLFSESVAVDLAGALGLSEEEIFVRSGI